MSDARDLGRARGNCSACRPWPSSCRQCMGATWPCRMRCPSIAIGPSSRRLPPYFNFQEAKAGNIYRHPHVRVHASRQDDACAAAAWCAASLAVGARCVEPPPSLPSVWTVQPRAHVRTCTCTHCHAATAHWHANRSSAWHWHCHHDGTTPSSAQMAMKHCVPVRLAHTTVTALPRRKSQARVCHAQRSIQNY